MGLDARQPLLALRHSLLLGTLRETLPFAFPSNPAGPADRLGHCHALVQPAQQHCTRFSAATVIFGG
jgi:hypothetical protein